MKSILLRAPILFICFSLLMISNVNAQTTYTYSGVGTWYNAANWSPSFPGIVINTEDTAIIEGDVTIGNNVTINGTLVINNGGTLFCDLFLLNYGTVTNEGTIDNSNGGVLYNLIGGTITNNGTINNLGSFENYGTINNTMEGTINSLHIDNYIDGTFNNDGIIDINGTLDNDGIFINNGTLINFGNGILNFGNLMNNGMINESRILYNYEILINNGTIDNVGGNFSGGLVNFGTLTNNGILENVDGIDVSGNLFNIGTLNGINTSHTKDFSNVGLLSPGNSPGTYFFNNNYTHESTASLLIELESVSDFDFVDVNGTATLNGILDVSLLNDFTPSVGDTFIILAATTVSGTFETTNFPSGYTWEVIYTATTVTLEVTAILSTLDLEISGFNMYPNPANDLFTIQLQQGQELKKVNIYNNLGQLIKTVETKIIKTSNMATGIYYVEVVTNQGISTKKPIIV